MIWDGYLPRTTSLHPESISQFGCFSVIPFDTFHDFVMNSAIDFKLQKISFETPSYSKRNF